MGKGGGGGGGPVQSTSTSYQTNIPEYARPYVETMLGATQKQLFTTQDKPGVYNPETGQTTPGGTEITGFQPYRAFGGTYDAQGNQTAYDPSKSVAGFTPLQERAQQATAGLQVPGQYAQGMDVTGAGIMGALGTAGQAGGYGGMGAGYGAQAAGAGQQYAQQATNPYAMQAYMSPYMQNVVDVQQREAQRMSDILGTQQRSQATQQGAFGGSRQGLMEAERQRNLATQQGEIQAKGLQSAFDQARQAQQFGSTLGLQGLQAGMQGAGLGLQGVGAQLAGYGQAMQGGQQLANLGQQQLGAQQSIIGAQNQMGAQQQAYNQQVINQAIQDYANAQQYPLMQLGTMSNMLRGLPMQAQTTNQYVAAPNPITQGIGAAGTYGALKNAGVFGAAGGLPSEFETKRMAKGGITSIPSYDVGGEVADTLEDMDNSALQREAKESSSPTIRRMAQRLLKERAMESGVAPAGPMGVQYKAPGMARGGILAFAEPTEENNRSLVREPIEPAVSEATRRARIEPAVKPGTFIEPAVAPPRAAEAPPPQAAEAPPQAAEAPALAPAPAGITAAAPAAPAPASSTALENIRAAVAKAEAEAAKPESDFLARVKEGMPVDTETAKYRQTLMAERANAEDEKKRQKNMRLAQFFAKWGSTPGPVLVAGMNAVNEMIPGLITDEQEFKKARKESDKIMFDLDRAVRLEEMGHKKEARALKEKASDRAKDLQHYLVQAQTSIEGHNISAEASRYAADKRLEGDKLQAAATAANRQATLENTAEYRAATGLQNARRELGDVQADVDKLRGKDDVQKLLRSVDSYERALANTGKKTREEQEAALDKQRPAMRKSRDEAYNRLYGEKGILTAAEARVKAAQDAVEEAKVRWQNLGGSKTGKKPEKAEGSGNDPFGLR